MLIVIILEIDDVIQYGNRKYDDDIKLIKSTFDENTDNIRFNTQLPVVIIMIPINIYASCFTLIHFLCIFVQGR